MTRDEYEAKAKELLKELPEEFHAGVSHLAYEQGHAYGWAEVWLVLGDLVDTFAEPCKKFEKRIRSTK